MPVVCIVCLTVAVKVHMESPASQDCKVDQRAQKGRNVQQEGVQFRTKIKEFVRSIRRTQGDITQDLSPRK